MVCGISIVIIFNVFVYEGRENKLSRQVSLWALFTIDNMVIGIITEKYVLHTLLPGYSRKQKIKYSSVTRDKEELIGFVMRICSFVAKFQISMNYLSSSY